MQLNLKGIAFVKYKDAEKRNIQVHSKLPTAINSSVCRFTKV